MAQDDTIGTVRRIPTLLVALGGTGMRTARYALWLATRGGDQGLQAMHEAGEIQVVAVDTDWKANREDVFVEEYVVPTSGAGAGSAGQEHRRLPRVPRVVLVKTEDITRAVQSIRARHRGRLNGHDHDDHDDEIVELNSRWTRRNGLKLEECLSWLPQVDPRAGEEISPGQARYEGAGQWRPLGRVGLFLEARAILDELREGHRRIRNATPLERPVRVHIICSLSGGTGSGMFWDIACLLRHIDPSCTITGSFLLAEPFRGADRAERIEANAYAALKELAVYKNLQQPKPFEVLYPIGPNGLRFRREPNDPSIFDYVYVYQGFAPSQQTAAVGDVNEAAIETSCFRLAQSIMAQMRDDVRARIDEGANNERSDTNAPPGHPERGYVFSSSAVAELEIGDSTQLHDTLETAYLQTIRERLIGRDRPILQDADLAKALFTPMIDHIKRLASDPTAEEPVDGDSVTILVRGDAARNNKGEESLRFPMITSVDSYKSVLEATRRAAELRPSPDYQSIARMLDGLNKLEKALDQPEPADITDAKRRERVMELYRDSTCVDPALREGWNACMLRETWRDGSLPKTDAEPVVAQVDIADFLIDDARTLWHLLQKGIDDAKAALHANAAAITVGAREVIEVWRRQMDSLWQDQRRGTVTITAPGSLVQLRPALGLLRPDHPADRILNDAISKTGYCGPVKSMMKRFASQLRRELVETVAKRTEVRDGLSLAFAGYIVKNRATVKDHLKTLLDAADGHERMMRERADHVLSLGHGRLSHIYPDPDGPFERFEQALGTTLVAALDRLTSEESVKASDAAAERLARLAESVARAQNSPALPLAIDFQANEEQVKLWAALLRALSPALTTGAAHSSERFVTRLARLLETHFHPEWNVEDARDEQRFKKRLARMRVVFTAFIRYWAEQEEFVLARLGGEDGMRETLANCRSRVFGKGSVAPSIQQDKLVIGKPLVVDGSAEQRSNTRSRLEQSFRIAAQATMNQAPMFCREPTARPIVYYEQLYRSGAEIVDIDRYHRSYTAVPEEQRALHHITSDAAALPDLMEGNNQAQPRRAAWTCTDSNHEDIQIPWTEEICPSCMAEYEQGIRPLHLVSRRNAKETPLPCPGCDPQHPLMIPASMTRFLFNGVRPSELATFELQAERLELDIRCKHTAGSRHLIFPSIEVMEAGKRRWLHVYREGGHFISTRDGSHIEHSCFHCGFPITDRQLEAIRDGRKVTCPRCQRALRECHYCSHRDHALFQPLAVDHGPDRCPRCSNLMHRHPRDFDLAPKDGLSMPGFCRNIFGCPAGGTPWSTAAEIHRATIADHSGEVCDSCHDHHDPALLLPWDDLREHVERCPICLTLIGLPRSGGVHRLAPDELVSHLLHHVEDDPSRHCVLCGTEPGAVVQWMLHTNYFDRAASAIPKATLDELEHRYSGRFVMPALDAGIGIEFLELMNTYDDDRKLFEAARAIPGIIGPKRRFSDLETEMRRLFTGRSLTPRVVARRLAQLTHIEDDVRARQEGRSGQLVKRIHTV